MSKVKAVPEGLRTITPALAIDGCHEAIELYKKALGAEVVMLAPDPSGKKVWHAAIKIGDSQIFVNDTFPEMDAKPSYSEIWIYTEHVDAAFKRAVDAGMSVRMPLGDMFWGDRMGCVVDKWGLRWTFAQHIADLTPEEMQKAQDDFVAKQKG